MRLPLALLISVLFGVTIEVAQIPVPGRFGGDGHDILANTLGAACAVVALRVLRHLKGRRPTRG